MNKERTHDCLQHQSSSRHDMSNQRHCDYNNFKRARYFHGMLLTERDFREEQIYHNEKRKLLNRVIHGWGVVCGLGIKGESGKSTITVEAGMALDCHGNEIVVCEPLNIDLTSAICKGDIGSRKRPMTPQDCEKLEAAQPDTYYIGIRYHEVTTDPIPVYVPGGGCEEKVCEYSRSREGFCIKIFEQPPAQPHRDSISPSLIQRFVNASANSDTIEERLRKQMGKFQEEFCSNPPSCPDCCPEEHYVILGRVVVNPTNRTIEEVWLDGDRSYVMTNHLFRYIFSSLLSGLDTFFVKEKKDDTTEQLPDINLIHTNPIAALCWLGQMFIEEARIRPAEPEAEVVKTLFARVAEMEKLKKEVKDLRHSVEALQKKAAKKEVSSK